MGELTRLEQELGVDYQRKMIDYLGSPRVLNHGYSPTWWITCNNDWKGKSYWVRKALNQMKSKGLVESFRNRGSIGWCWALKGKLSKW